MNNNKMKSYFRKKTTTKLTILVTVFIVYFIAATITRFSFIDMIFNFTGFIDRAIDKYSFNDTTLGILPEIFDYMLDTIYLAVSASVISGILAFVLALFASDSIRISGRAGIVISFMVRIFASLTRNIPTVVWALILFIAYSNSLFTGFLALFIYSLGFLTRAYIEVINNSAKDSVEALKSSGANKFQIVSQSIVPSTAPSVISWLIYMIETNIRSSTLVGMVSGVGIGFLFKIYNGLFEFDKSGLIIVSIGCMIVITEIISINVRRILK